jgi:hypothetical protein
LGWILTWRVDGWVLGVLVQRFGALVRDLK